MAEDRSGRLDDAALVRSVAGGSYDALADLYDRHGAAIFAVASRLTSDRGIAEEVVQDTFLALWDRATSFDPATGSLAAWLHTIARNRTVDRLRAAGRRPVLVAPPGQDDEGTDTGGLDRVALGSVVVGGAGAPVGPEAAAVSHETRSMIETSLAGMPDEERTVIVLAYRDGLSQSEIAERLDWPLGTVKTRTRRALHHLRVVLEAQWDTGDMRSAPAAMPVGPGTAGQARQDG
jgi:RNA polymerase sigma-70 factor, ECF subfamily